MNEEGKSRIEGLNEKLNSRTRYRNPLDKRSPVKDFESPDVLEKWQTPELDEMLKHERIPLKIGLFMKKIFIFALLFFIAAIVISGFVFLGGTNFVSSKNVNINVLGPTSISAGEVLELGITISNSNNADLEFANLSIQYPQGSRNPDNTVESLTYTKDNLGVIEAGAETVRNVRMVLLGSSGDIKEIKLSVEYKVKGSNATFYKDKIFEVVIGSSPIVLTVENPSTTVSGESFTMKVSVALNATEVLKNVILKAEYPHGYSVLDSSQKPVDDNNVWVLGDLTPGSKKTISIRGQLIGEDKEERTFRFYAGVSDSIGVGNNLKITIVSLLNTIVISRPSIGLDVLFNGENVPIYVAPAARTVHTSFRFKNNLSDKLLNPRLEASLSGVVLDKLSIKAGNNGLYDSSGSKIVWNLTNSLGLSELAPGESGQVTLEFSSLPNLSTSRDAHDVTLTFLITGVPVDIVGQGAVSVKDTRIVRISSQVSFSSKVLRSLGSFSNRGPIPPKVGEETTYSVIFSIGNTRGDLVDAKVTARLGQGVSWLGPSSFTSEDVSYDSLSQTVTWNVGVLSSDTGFSSAIKELPFQIALTPSLGQIGTAPSLLTNIVFSGRDTVTGDMVTVNNPPLTTRLVSDPVFIQGDDIVVK
ncbi:MAG: hypothetical protein Q7K26_02690 [bacterium]|nr:hypothetical protein [bacterium]